MDYSEYAIHFEAVKSSLRQDKNGFSLTLVIHPNDVPHELIKDWVGARYMVALVKMTDDEQPEPRPEKDAAKRMSQTAAMLCQDARFQRYLCDIGWASEMSEEDAANALREGLLIDSRSELYEKARQEFTTLVEDFRKHAEL